MGQCVICNTRPATQLADSDSFQYANGMPTCVKCFVSYGLDPAETSVPAEVWDRVFGQESA